MTIHWSVSLHQGCPHQSRSMQQRHRRQSQRQRRHAPKKQTSAAATHPHPRDSHVATTINIKVDCNIFTGEAEVNQMPMMRNPSVNARGVCSMARLKPMVVSSTWKQGKQLPRPLAPLASAPVHRIWFRRPMVEHVGCCYRLTTTTAFERS